MFIDKFKPLFAPEVEGGQEAPAEPAAPPPLNERPVDGPGSGRSEVRKQLEKSFDSARRGDEQREREREQRERDESGRFTSRARQEGLVGEEQEQEQPAEQAAEGEQEQPAEQTQEQPAAAAPEGWAREAKAEWAKLSPTVQAAVAKRETDMAKGVEDLKKRYTEIDQALAPRMELIRRHNQTPASAVNQLFAWFEALSSNPIVSFPALAESFKFDLRNIPGLVPLQQPQPGQQPAPQGEAAQQGDIPPQVVEHIKNLEQRLMQTEQGFNQRLGQLGQTFQQQEFERTKQSLNQWSKDKPYFEEVRRTMGQLIEANTVPPLPDGNADLDRVYDMALWALPEVRAKVLAEQQKKADDARKAKEQAERKAQQEQANKARRAQGGSLSLGAPGSPVEPGKAKGKGKSVRESLMEAREELSGR